MNSQCPFNAQKHRFQSIFCKISEQVLPYESNLFQSIISSDPVENAREILNFILEIHEFNFFLRHEICENRIEITNVKKKNGDQLISRFHRYCKLKQDGLSDIDIIRNLYKELPEDGREPWKNFYNRMKTWRNRHTDIINNGIKPVHLSRENVKNWKPKDGTYDLSYNACLEKFQGTELLKDLFLYYKHIFEGQGKNLRMLLCWHFLIRVEIQILSEIVCANENWSCYDSQLQELSEAIAILEPQRYQELWCLSEGTKVKSKIRPQKSDSKIDVARALAETKLGKDAAPENLVACTHTFQRKQKLISKRRDFLTRTIPEKKNPSDVFDSADVARCFLELKHAKQAKRRKRIHDWAGVLNLLSEYCSQLLPMVDGETILIEILIKCQKMEKFWKCPSELKLRKYYLILLRSGFFNELKKRLAENVTIPDKKNVFKGKMYILYPPWKRVPYPQGKLFTVAELNGAPPEKTYTPYRGSNELMNEKTAIRERRKGKEEPTSVISLTIA